MNEKNRNGNMAMSRIKLGKLFRKAMTIILAAAMLITTLPQMSLVARADTLKKVSVNTTLDGGFSRDPGEVTLRQNGRIVYTLKERAAGKYAMGIIFGTNTTFDVFVGDLDTGVDVTPEALTHRLYHRAGDKSTG